MKAPVHRLRRVAEPVLGVLAVILLWELASRHAANATLVPPPAVVWRAFVAMQGTDLPLDIGASLLHLLIGYGLGATAGLLLALIATARNQWRRVDAAAWRGIEAAANPMGRAGTPEDMAGAALLLCSDAGAFITGADLQATGGAHL